MPEELRPAILDLQEGEGEFAFVRTVFLLDDFGWWGCSRYLDPELLARRFLVRNRTTRT